MVLFYHSFIVSIKRGIGHCIRSVAGGVNAFQFAVNFREFPFWRFTLDVVEKGRISLPFLFPPRFSKLS